MTEDQRSYLCRTCLFWMACFGQELVAVDLPYRDGTWIWDDAKWVCGNQSSRTYRHPASTALPPDVSAMPLTEDEKKSMELVKRKQEFQAYLEATGRL